MADSVWREWGEPAIAEAKASERPLLLLLVASWCRHCRELEEGVLREPDVAAALERRFVPVRVDKDARPDLDQKYRRGGWPTLLVVTADGEAGAGGAALASDEVRALVLGTSRPKSKAPHVGELSTRITDRVAHATLEAFDARHGGFGTGQKFPHPETLDFVLFYAEKSRSPAFREIALKTLTEMAESQLLDPVAGGFFRYCATRDWRHPATEKPLETQAGLLRNFLEGWQLFDRPDFRKVAQKTLSYVEHSLRDAATGAWFSGQEADDGYYALPERARLDRKPPRVEPTIYATSVAVAISALLKAGAVLDDEAATQHALEGTRFLVGTLYSPGKGVYHSWTAEGNRQILGRLVDQVFALRALLHVVQFTGENHYLSIVEDLIASISRKQSAQYGGFYDLRDDDPKFVQTKRRQSTLLENGLMAETLVRAHCLTGKAEYRELARRTLEAFTADFPLYGYFAAEYARAVELWFHPPLRVVVVGSAHDERRRELLAMARKTFAPSKLVLALDPSDDADLLARHAFPARDRPIAYVGVEGACTAEVDAADAIPDAMAHAETLRTQSAALR